MRPCVDIDVISRIGNIAFDVFPVRVGARVVDVGCGDGRLAAQMVRAGLHVTGIEPEAYLRERFLEQVTAVDPQSIAVDGLADRLPFADGRVRHVVMTEVLEHVADPSKALAELRRVLTPDGMLCLSVPTSYTELVYWRLHPRYAKNATHERIFTKPELRRLILASGFRIERWEGRNFLPAVSWIVHALLRSDADHTGEILEHVGVDRLLARLWVLLLRVHLLRPVEWAGNRVWAKSWYVYCRAVS